VLHDRDSKFSAAFDEVFQTEGARVIRTPVRAPNANAHAERLVRTVRSECLDWILILGRRQLERVLWTYVDHYNRQRPHRALDLKVPDPGGQLMPLTRVTPTSIRRRDRLGGLHLAGSSVQLDLHLDGILGLDPGSLAHRAIQAQQERISPRAPVER
jgi:putative transposase